MIYEFPQQDAPIRQGDIFANLPRVDLSLRSLAVVTDSEQIEQTSWGDLVSGGKSDISAVCGIKSVAAIVATQDCDAQRSSDITLCEIRSIVEVDGSFKSCNSASSWMKVLTQQARKNLKWFYLPPDPTVGFTKKMGADFLVTIRVPLGDLLAYRNLRRARLNAEADEHFRERLSEFFRRYPYDEWYALNGEEFAKYREQYPESEPRDWQQRVEAQ